MRYKGRRQSSNIEDRRGMSTRKKIGIRGGAFSIIAAIVIILLGGNPRTALNLLQIGPQTTQTYDEDHEISEHEKELTDFVKVVLADTEDVWNLLFKNSGLTYREPTLVLFEREVQSACGFSSAATGPFYCPGDEKVYIDLNFLEQLQRKLGAEGDFATAYIIAHEVGHHVQNLLGASDKVHSLRNKVSEEKYNEQTVRLELQADFYAGIWAHHAQKMKNIIETGDLKEAINAAQAVGDDRIQMNSRGYVTPESFTHGTSEQRMKWFKKGFDTGDPNQGDTFSPNVVL